MPFLRRLQGFLADPPPEYAFEVSSEGISWCKLSDPAALAFAPLEPGVLAVTPLRDNVLRPDEFARTIARLAPPGGARKPRRCTLILPDYCARIAVLDFDTLPSDTREILSLVRFRIKKSLPFDADSAVVSVSPQPRHGESRKLDVVVAAVALEVAARYEAPFRQALYQPGYVTVSSLAALSLAASAPPHSPVVAAKLSGRVLALSILYQGSLRFYRSLELASDDPNEVLDVLFPTFAYVEDELGAAPRTLLSCGARFDAQTASALEAGLNLRIELARSRFGPVNQYNAGLLGYLESPETR
jgi:type IV pilus assembly protein PilM